MPITPFPYPIHLGTDICHVPRIARLWNEQPTRFLRRVFNELEVLQFAARFARSTMDPRVVNEKLIPQYLAARWAAKEAAIKAIKPRRITFHDVVVSRDYTSGSPIKTLVLAPGQAQAFTPWVTIGLSDVELAKRVQPPQPLWWLSKRQGLHLIQEIHLTRRKGYETTLKDRLAELDCTEVLQSISHEAEYTTAVCLAVSDSASDSQPAADHYHTSRLNMMPDISVPEESVEEEFSSNDDGPTITRS